MRDASQSRWAMLTVLIVCLLGAGFFISDPINRLRIRLTWEDFHSMGWQNGLWGIVHAPAGTSPTGLVSAYGASYKLTAPITILESKEVSLYPSPRIYTVVLVDGPHGRKLLVFEPSLIGWSVREYDP